MEVAIVALPHMANFDEFDPLARRSDTRLRYVREAADFGSPDLVILPGSKVTIADLDFVRDAGFEGRIRNHLWNGRALIGICGGMQMLGNSIHDPGGIESERPVAEGLGVLDIETRFMGDKLTTRTEGRIVGGRGLLSGAGGMNVSGYEIHVGVTESDDGASRAVETADGSAPLGYADRTGRVLGAYMHDLFKNAEFADSVIGNVARMKGLDQSVESEPFSQEAEFDKLAAHLRARLDMEAVYAAMGL